MIFNEQSTESSGNNDSNSNNNKMDFDRIRDALRELSADFNHFNLIGSNSSSNNSSSSNEECLRALQSLLSDRNRWRAESVAFSQESSKLQVEKNAVERERDVLRDTVEGLKRDLISSNNRTSTLLNEQRDLRNHWLAEKSDLQSRLCQVQALNTQIQGTLKKKEKDFDKLQAQLAKLVKDSQRGAKATIVVSAPIRKPMSQDTANAGGALLRDAEITALRNSLKKFQSDNTLLQQSVESVKSNLADLQSTFESKLQDIEEQHKIHVESIVHEHSVTQQQQSLTFQKNIEVISINPQTPQAVVDRDFVPMSIQKSALRKTPGTIARKYLEGTPSARPINWIVEQANTEIKLLRSRVEDIASGNGGTSNISIEEASLGGEAVCKIVNLRARLAEALMVIQEQDRLIHEALLGKLPGMEVDPAMIAWEIDLDEDEALTGGSDYQHDLSSSLGNELDFPPASPDTFTLLKSYGWSVPRGTQELESIDEETCAEHLEFS